MPTITSLSLLLRKAEEIHHQEMKKEPVDQQPIRVCLNTRNGTAVRLFDPFYHAIPDHLWEELERAEQSECKTAREPTEPNQSET